MQRRIDQLAAAQVGQDPDGKALRLQRVRVNVGKQHTFREVE